MHTPDDSKLQNETEADTEAIDEKVDYTAKYSDVLAEMYYLIIDVEANENLDDGFVGVFEAARALGDAALEEIGYLLYDINGDDIPELLIGCFNKADGAYGSYTKTNSSMTCTVTYELFKSCALCGTRNNLCDNCNFCVGCVPACRLCDSHCKYCTKICQKCGVRGECCVDICDTCGTCSDCAPVCQNCGSECSWCGQGDVCEYCNRCASCGHTCEQYKKCAVGSCKNTGFNSATFVCAAMNTVIVLKTNARAATKRRTCAGTATDVRIVAIAVISRKKTVAQSAETTTIYSVKNVLPARNAQESAVGVTSRVLAAMTSVLSAINVRDAAPAEKTRSL